MDTATTTTTYPFLAGGGEMGALTRNYDWSATALGTPDQWPLSLRTTVGIILHSAFPTLLLWGPNLLCFYNDAFRVSLGNNGKHPAVGKRGVDVWPEVWDFTGPLVEQVMRTGEPIFYEDKLVPIYRNGTLEDVCWTFSYSPAYDDAGQINGVFVTCIETTQTVVSRRELKASEFRFRSIIEQAPTAIGLFGGRNMIIEIGNKRIFEVWDKNPSVIGMPVIDALPEIKGQGYIELLEGVYDTGVPFAGNSLLVKLNRQGKLEDVYFDLLYTPLRDATDTITGVMVLANEVTEQVMSRQKIEESETRYRTLAVKLEVQVQERTEELKVANEELAATNEELAVANEELAGANTELIESNNLLLRSNDNLQKFAYVASHDLQEPLRKIQQFGDLLKGQYAQSLGEGVDYLGRMQSAASRMSALIRDLLNFSRISTQREADAPVPLGGVVSAVLTDLDLRIQEAGAVVTVEPMPTIHGDQSQLEQLFQNLISNALKFHRVGVSPVIRITNRLVVHQDLPPPVKPARSAPLYHQISVADNGIGFDERYVDRIFQVFQRLHGRSEFAGTGIGLAICESVAANHGGAITATGQPGQGATFSLYLPV